MNQRHYTRKVDFPADFSLLFGGFFCPKQGYFLTVLLGSGYSFPLQPALHHPGDDLLPVFDAQLRQDALNME